MAVLSHKNKLILVAICLCLFLCIGSIMGVTKVFGKAMEARPCYETIDDAKNKINCLTHSVTSTIYGGNFAAMVGCLIACYIFMVMTAGKDSMRLIMENHGVYEIVLWSLILAALVGTLGTFAMSWFGYYQGDKHNCKCKYEVVNGEVREIDAQTLELAGMNIDTEIAGDTGLGGEGFNHPKGPIATIQFWISRIGGYGMACCACCFLCLFMLQWIQRRSPPPI